jgi:hypothetical protein
MVSMSRRPALRNCFCLALAAVSIFSIIIIASCGETGAVTPERISSGNMLRDKIINGLRVQLKIRQVASQEAIQAYLSAANTAGATLSFNDQTAVLPLSVDIQNLSQIAFGLIREMGKLGSSYSFASETPAEEVIKIRTSVVRYFLVYSRIFGGLDSSQVGAKAEFIRASSFGFVSGFPSEGLSDSLKKSGLDWLVDSLMTGIADTKWSDSSLLAAYSAYSLGALSGLGSTSLPAEERQKVSSKIYDDSLKKIADLKVTPEQKISSVSSKTAVQIALLKRGGFSAAEIPDAAAAIIAKGIAALGEIPSIALESEIKVLANMISGKTIESFSESMTSDELTAVYKMIASSLLDAYKTKANSLPDGFGAEIEAKMAEGINSSAANAAGKTAANTGITKGISKVVTGTDPDVATPTPTPTPTPDPEPESFGT